MKKELNFQEMNEIKGGITREEYCAILGSMLYPEQWESWNENQQNAWVTAYFTHCID